MAKNLQGTSERLPARAERALEHIWSTLMLALLSLPAYADDPITRLLFKAVDLLTNQWAVASAVVTIAAIDDPDDRHDGLALVHHAVLHPVADRGDGDDSGCDSPLIGEQIDGLEEQPRDRIVGVDRQRQEGQQQSTPNTQRRARGKRRPIPQ